MAEASGPIRSLGQLKVYQLAMELGKEAWEIASSWDSFARQTLGKQWVRAADSVAANLAEGYGRFHFRENLQFCYYARGSLHEARTWMQKAQQRDLIEPEKYADLNQRLNQLEGLLNGYLRYIRKTIQETKK